MTQPIPVPDREETARMTAAEVWQLILIDVAALTTQERWQLHQILGRAVTAPSIGAPVSDLLRRIQAFAYLLIPADAREAEMSRRLDAALDGRTNRPFLLPHEP